MKRTVPLIKGGKAKGVLEEVTVQLLLHSTSTSIELGTTGYAR
jgi:hypothetical protein